MTKTPRNYVGIVIYRTWAIDYDILLSRIDPIFDILVSGDVCQLNITWS